MKTATLSFPGSRLSRLSFSLLLPSWSSFRFLLFGSLPPSLGLSLKWNIRFLFPFLSPSLLGLFCLVAGFWPPVASFPVSSSPLSSSPSPFRSPSLLPPVPPLFLCVPPPLGWFFSSLAPVFASLVCFLLGLRSRFFLLLVPSSSGLPLFLSCFFFFPPFFPCGFSLLSCPLFPRLPPPVPPLFVLSSFPSLFFLPFSFPPSFCFSFSPFPSSFSLSLPPGLFVSSLRPSPPSSVFFFSFSFFSPPFCFSSLRFFFSPLASPSAPFFSLLSLFPVLLFYIILFGCLSYSHIHVWFPLCRILLILLRYPKCHHNE